MWARLVQGLKPRFLQHVIGMAEAMPCDKASYLNASFYKRLGAVLAIAVGLVASGGWSANRVLAANPGVQVQFATDGVQPRQVEDATQASVVRDYKTAWQNLAGAMEHNRAELLDASFVGFAHDKFGQAVEQQKKNGLRRRYVDHGHKLEAVFYSYDGSALQLKDTASVEVQLMDGDKVISSQPGTIYYMVLMTPAENSWKVRDMEAVPSF